MTEVGREDEGVAVNQPESRGPTLASGTPFSPVPFSAGCSVTNRWLD